MNSHVFILNIFDFFTTAVFVLVFIRIILSWAPNARNAFTQVIFDLTEPLLKPFRIINPKNSPLDFSPIILIILLEVARSILSRIL